MLQFEAHSHFAYSVPYKFGIYVSKHISLFLFDQTRQSPLLEVQDMVMTFRHIILG